MRDSTTHGKNASLVAGSVQIASSSETLPETTSRNPIRAFGASLRVSDGLRRSQSSKIVREPACAVSCARAVETVVLPSLGSEDVIAMTLLDLLTPKRSAAILIARTDSENRENGESITCHNQLWSRTIILDPAEDSFIRAAGTRRLVTLLDSLPATGPRLALMPWTESVNRDNREPMTRRNCLSARTIGPGPLKIGILSSPATSALRLEASFTIGRMAMQSACKSSSTCRLVRKTRSEKSRSMPMPKAKIIPPAIAIASTSSVLGWLFLRGGVAWVIKRDSVIGNDCCCTDIM